MNEDDQTLAAVKAAILDLPPADRDHVLAEADKLLALITKDPRQALVIALVGAKLAAAE